MIFSHPGPWQQFSLRSDNRGLSTMELKSKYINEQYLFEAQMAEVQHQHNIFMNGGGGGPQPTTATPPVVITDSDVLAFITATGITDNTQKSAVNSLVLSLKGYSVWSSLNVIYPFVGGTATTHKFNLKDPRDLDAAYRLTFFGGMTHNSNGITGNGTNAYAKITTPPTTTAAAGVYTRTTSFIGYLMSGYRYYASTDPEAPDPIPAGGFGIAVGGYSGYNPNVGGNFAPYVAGLLAITNTAVNSIRSFKNGAFKDAYSAYNFTAPSPVSPIGIGTRYEEYYDATNTTLQSTDFSSYLSPNNIAFAFISNANLTDAQMGNIYTAVQAYQTTLGRQV